MTARYLNGLYVYSAVPPNANRLLRKYGLLSGVETIRHPEVLRAARPDAEQRKAFVKKVKDVAKSERPYPVQGPSVFFTMPDPAKITKKHFIKQWDLRPIRINLGRLVADYPDTVVWGAELLPYDKAWRKMSDEDFDEVMADMGYASWEDFAAERSRALTLDEVYDFTQMRPEDLWEYYPKSDAGKMYASNVPHAFIITPMGYIPYEYLEYVGEARENSPAAKAPTFTCDAQGYLCNPLSDSGISWWHVTSPYTLDIEEEGFRIPSYFASDIDSICQIVMSIRRPDPVTLYDVKLRIRPENLLSPQTIFKDWVRCWLETYEDGYGQEWDDEANDPNPWFNSPEFINELTPLGKGLYREVVVAARVTQYSVAAIMSMMCGCKYQAFDILKNAGQGRLFEEWCWRNNIYAWVESEMREGWAETPSGTWAPVDGFNIGVWDTSRVEIVEVFPDILECEYIVDIEAVVGRRNPQDIPRSSKMDIAGLNPDGYLTNPNTNDTIWWHFTPAQRLDAFNMHSYRVKPGSGMTFMGRSRSGMYTPHTATFFGGSPVPFYGRFEVGEAEVLQVKIRLGEDCRFFDARSLFSDVPNWVTKEMERALLETMDFHEIEDALPESGNKGSLSKEAFDYLMSQNLGETLNLWRRRFNAYRDMNPYSVEKLIQMSDMRGLISCYDKYESWAAFSLALWGLHYPAVQCVMNSYNHTKNEYPISGEERSYVGWLERESVFNGLDPDYDSINVAILHTPDTHVPYVDIECLEMTEVEIIDRERENPKISPMCINNPYPHYIDCNDALRDLKKVIAPDLNVQRAYVLEQIGKLIEFNERFSDYSDLYDDGELEDLAERVRRIGSLTDLTRLVQAKLPPTYTPLYFLIHGAEILQNVEFAHSLPAQRAASVEASGIYGRATPSKLTLTREISDFYLAGNGYIFAYEYNDYMDMANPAVYFSTYLSGTAEFALKFYFIPDQEHQLIVPVKCIQRYQVDEWPDEYAPLGGWPDDVGHAMLPDPKDTQQ